MMPAIAKYASMLLFVSALQAAESNSRRPALPSPSNGWYRTIVNAGIGMENYLHNLGQGDRLVTDFSGHVIAANPQLNTLSKVRQAYQASLAVITAARPDLLIGVYHSVRDVEDYQLSYPPRAIGHALADLLPTKPYIPPPASRLDGRRYVDYRRPEIRERLVHAIADDLETAHARLAFLDNVSHSCLGWPILWTDTLRLIRELTAELHRRSIAAIANIAWDIGNPECGVSTPAELIASGLDGIALEMPLTRHIGPSVLSFAMRQYRTLLDAGLTVILISDAPDAERARDSAVLAAWGLMFRAPGDKLFVAWPFFSPPQPWFRWPAELENPSAPAAIARGASGDLLLERRFGTKLLALNLTKKEVRFENLSAGNR